MDIAIASNAKVIVNQNIGFLPNTKVTIEKDGEFWIQDSHKA